VVGEKIAHDLRCVGHGGCVLYIEVGVGVADLPLVGTLARLRPLAGSDVGAPVGVADLPDGTDSVSSWRHESNLFTEVSLHAQPITSRVSRPRQGSGPRWPAGLVGRAWSRHRRGQPSQLAEAGQLRPLLLAGTTQARIR